MYNRFKVLHQPSSSECVTTFPCSLPRACPNDNEGKLQKFAMAWIGIERLCVPFMCIPPSKYSNN